ncbi:unnamed protein product [Rotaria sp. Silwood1]|nr:unnamed protein product [Rotaria sp. Silwood1]
MWTINGIPICVQDSNYNPMITYDAVGGAIITWQSYRNSSTADIYAQRVDSNGAIKWLLNGVPLCVVVFDQNTISMVNDGNGGAILTWRDYRANIGLADIYAQRVDSTGAMLWVANGVSVCNQAAEQSGPRILSDGAGGAFVTWADNRAGDYDIYTQRISSGGAPQWTTNGVATCTSASDQLTPDICSDGAAGVIITWSDFRSTTDFNIYAQRQGPAGAIVWTVDGIVMNNNVAYAQTEPKIISDGLGGAIMTWTDFRTGILADIYAQRVNSTGAVLWTATGVTICTAGGDQIKSQLISDGNNGAYIAWEDHRNAGNADIYVQRIASDASLNWSANGVAVCASAYDQLNPSVISNGNLGALVVWQDFRGGNDFDIVQSGFDTSLPVELASFVSANKVAIVTGAGSGIGKAIALLYAEHGAKVVVSDINEKSGKEVTEEIISKNGTAVFFKADTSKPKDQENLVKEAMKHYAEYTIEGWNKIIGINLSGVFFGMHYQIPAMLASGGGSIVNTSSILGQVGTKNLAGYVAAKHAVVGLTKTAALDYAEQNIRVNAVGPGYIQTPLLTDTLDKKTIAALAGMHPMNRLGEASEVAELVLWLSSSKASFVTGSYYAQRLEILTRTNKYDAGTNSVTVDPVIAEAFEANLKHYSDIFIKGNNDYAIPKNTLVDTLALRQLASFYYWSAWAASTNRPNENYTYTSNWPHEELIGNVPTGDTVVWTGVSIIILLIGIGAMSMYYIIGKDKKEEALTVSLIDPMLSGVSTPSQKAVIKYFFLVTGLILIQIIMGVITGHYGVEGNGFYGINLAAILPYSVSRTWHVQLAIFWIATSWLAAGLYVGPSISGTEPKGQRFGVNVLFGALLVVVLGSMAGQWMSIMNKLTGDNRFLFGHQGYEYLDLGRIWQIALLVGLFLWLFLVARTIIPAIKKADKNENMPWTTKSMIWQDQASETTTT